LAQSS